MSMTEQEREGAGALIIMGLILGIPAYALRIPFGNTGFIIGIFVGIIFMLAIPPLRKLLIGFILGGIFLAFLLGAIWLLQFLIEKNR